MKKDFFEVNSKEVLSIKLNVTDENFLEDILESLEIELAKEDTKLLYLNTNFQNPTGFVFNNKTKKAVYDLCKKYDVTILEDDPYKIYNFDNTNLGKNIIELDKNMENVIYLNSLSKVFFPGIRIGFIVANPQFLEGISDIQKYTTSSPNLIMQGVAIKALQNGEIDKSIKHYFDSIGNKREQLLQGFEEQGLLSAESPINLSNSKG